ncbi:ABC transporter permease [Helicovermis profundi]
MNKLDLRLFRMLKNHKGQFIAVSLIVIIGLFSYVGFSMAMTNLKTTVNYYYDETNFADLFVELVKIPNKEITKLKKIDGISEISGRIVYDVPLVVKEKDEKVHVRMISVNPDNNQVNKLYKVKGDLIKDEKNDALVIQMFAEARGINLNSIIKAKLNGKVKELKVAGITASPEYIYLIENAQTLIPDLKKFGVVFISNKLAEDSFGMQGNSNELLIKVKNKEDIPRIKKELEDKLDKFGVKRVYERKEQLSNSMVGEEIKGGEKSSKAIPLIFLGVAAVIISVMISRLVSSNRVSIGVLKAMGYSNAQILIHYTKLSVIIGLFGASIGMIGGTIFSGFMAKMYTTYFFNIPILKAKIYPKYIILGILLSITFCIISGLFGARKVIGIHPAESMRPEAPKTGKRILIERINAIWKRVSFTQKIVIRNIFRSKKRFLFIAIGISLTYGMTMLPLTMTEQFSSMFTTQYGEFQKAEYSINFRSPINENNIIGIKELINTKEIEPKLEYPFEIVNGWKDKTVVLVGVRTNTNLYGFKNTRGDKISVPKTGILLSQNLAKSLGVKKGDYIKIKTFVPGREDKKVLVKDIIEQWLGINAYMNIENMQDLFVDRGMMTSIMLNSDDNVKGKLKNLNNITSIQSLSDISSGFKEYMKFSIFSIGIMLIFSGILGFAIVYNSTIMSINERQLEFSSLRVMGFHKNEIFSIILRENAYMTIFGLALGIPLSKFFVYGLAESFSTDIYTMSSYIAPNEYIITGVLTIIFIVLAQLATYGKIQKLDFIEALKNRTV